MNIKKIKKLNSGKYQVIFDNNEKITTYDDVILKENILYKKKLTSEEVNNINNYNNVNDIYFSLLKLINKRIRSSKEIYEYIDKYELNKTDRDNIINKLINNGLLNDEMFTSAYVSDKLRLSSDGPYKIKRDLIKLGIKVEYIDDALSNIDEEELLEKINKIINNKIRSYKGSINFAKDKIYYDMNNLGYSREMVDSVFEIDYDDSSSLEKDFKKIYSSLSKKEKDSNKLYYKIKQKLYQKGYSLDKIEEILEKVK